MLNYYRFKIRFNLNHNLIAIGFPVFGLSFVCNFLLIGCQLQNFTVKLGKLRKMKKNTMKNKSYAKIKHQDNTLCHNTYIKVNLLVLFYHIIEYFQSTPSWTSVMQTS